MNLYESMNKGFDKKYGKLLESADEQAKGKKPVKECDGACDGKKEVKRVPAFKKEIKECDKADGKVVSREALAKRKVKECADKKPLKEAPIYGLETVYDARQSFGGKAQVDSKRNGTDVLYSYGTPVCQITRSGEVTLFPRWNESMTTLRHVKEFLKQHDKRAENKSQIAADYKEGEFIDEGIAHVKDRKSAIKGAVRECADKRGKVVKAVKEEKAPVKGVAECQSLVDGDIKDKRHITEETMKQVRDAGCSVVKGKDGKYEVVTREKIKEAMAKKRIAKRVNEKLAAKKRK